MTLIKKSNFEKAKSSVIFAQNLCLAIIQEAVETYPGGRKALAKAIKREEAQLSTIKQAKVGTLLTVVQEIIEAVEKNKSTKKKVSKKKNR